MDISLNIFVLAFVFFVAAILVISLFLARSAQRKTQLLGIQLLQAGRVLLNHFQSHRGLTATFLSGDHSVANDIYDIRENISRDIARLASLDEWFSRHQDWEGITQHWARLSGKGFVMHADDSFEQHCRLVQSVLTLMETVASKYQLERGGLFEDIDVTWHELLKLGELIGQSRALGVRLLRLGEANPHLRQHKILISQNLSEVGLLVEKSSFKTKFSQKEKEELEHFLFFVKLHLVDNVGPLSASEYYHVATNAINIVYDRFDREVNAFHLKISP